jgi:hypothetical protein
LDCEPGDLLGFSPFPREAGERESYQTASQPRRAVPDDPSSEAEAYREARGASLGHALDWEERVEVWDDLESAS